MRLPGEHGLDPKVLSPGGAPVGAPAPRTVVRRILVATLAARLRLTSEPTYRDTARLSALFAAAANPRQRRVAAAAVHALDRTPDHLAVWRFTVGWWHERMVDEILSYQIDRMTRAWVRERIALTGAPLPPGGSILLSIHQWNQRLAFARLADVCADLGLVSMWQPTASDDAPRSARSLGLDQRQLSLSRASFEIFGPRVYSPLVAARRGLELLRAGGSLIVLADFFGQSLTPILGHAIPIADGVAWLAEQSGSPIVPFLMSPESGSGGWKVACGERIESTQASVNAQVERAIRTVPTTWMSWRGWYEGAPTDPPAAPAP